MVVIGALVYKARNAPSANPPLAGDIQVPAGEPISGDIVLPVGAKVVSQSLSGNRVSIDAELADGSRTIFIYDIAERRLIGRKITQFWVNLETFGRVIADLRHNGAHPLVHVVLLCDQRCGALQQRGQMVEVPFLPKIGGDVAEHALIA